MSLKKVEFNRFPASWNFRAEGEAGEEIPRALQAIMATWAASYPELAKEHQATEAFWAAVAAKKNPPHCEEGNGTEASTGSIIERRNRNDKKNKPDRVDAQGV
jgi:hypothetical protein